MTDQPDPPADTPAPFPPTQETIDGARSDHEARCGCTLPQPPQQVVGAQSLLASSTQDFLPGFFPFPMEVPSHKQNRTTRTPGYRARHPTNMNKPMLITTEESEEG